MRVGHGYDVHRLIAGETLVLCGQTIPHETGLQGHSDADVAVHAAIDALLGAAALGDIGRLFPDTDPAYRGADSIRLLAQVGEMLHSRGYQIGNLDLTIVAQRPKLSPYLPKMARAVAEALKIQTSQVSVKATTEEGLGFTGLQQGIAAHCVCLID